jgi:hypothetical protein
MMAEDRDWYRADVAGAIEAQWARLRVTIAQQRPLTPEAYRERHAELKALEAKWASLAPQPESR